jgi:DNA replication protein DnaC
MITEGLQTALKRLRLPGMAENLDLRLAEAEGNKLGYLDFFTMLVQDETANREANSFQNRLKLAGFSSNGSFETFDFEFNAMTMPPKTIRDLATCQFIEQRRNLVLAGPPGIGKSHIAQAIGYEAARRAMDVDFYKTHKLLECFSQDRVHTRRGSRILKRCLAVELLILDDFALRNYSQIETELLYTLSDERLNRGSIILTSNRPPEDWYAVFPDQVMGGAILDRLVSSAIKMISTSGRSWRKEGLGIRLNTGKLDS